MNDDSRTDARLGPEEAELAALYAAAALDETERVAVERRFLGQAAFWAEVRSYAGAVRQLAEDAPERTPRQDLWPAVQERLRAAAEARTQTASDRGPAPEGRSQVWKRWRAESGPETLLPAGAGDFEPTDIEGISVRRLFVDAASDRVTMLVRMAPGSAYPAHRHGGVEECYVLEGDLVIGSVTEMRAGDYQRMDRGSQHPRQSTRGGCLLLIAGSRHDELLP